MRRSLGRSFVREFRVLATDMASARAGFDFYDDERENNRQSNGSADASEYIVDIREYDVPYHVRVAIDKG